MNNQSAISCIKPPSPNNNCYKLPEVTRYRIKFEKNTEQTSKTPLPHRTQEGV